MERGTKRINLVWHRRSGKDQTCLNAQIKYAWKVPGVHYYFLPTFSQGRKIIWDGISSSGFRYIDHIPKEIRIGKPKEDDMQIKIRCKGGGVSIWQIVGIDKMDSIVGTNPLSGVFSEFSLQHPTGWELMRPIFRENGGPVMFNFTPRGNNHAKALIDIAKKTKNWYVDIKTVSDTRRPDGTPVIS